MGFSSPFAKPMLSNSPCIIQLRNRSTSYGEMERFFMYNWESRGVLL